MARAEAWAGTAFLVGILLAGCVGSSGSAGSEGLAPGADPNLGAVAGTAVDDQLMPLAGVLVSLDEATTFITDVGGEFRFDNVEPGVHRLSAVLDGYQNASREVEVAQGVVARTSLMLAPVPSDLPYHVILRGEGLLGCSATVEGTFLYYVNCEALFIAGLHTIDKHMVFFKVGPLDNATGFWAETVWAPNQIFARTLWIHWGISSGSQPSQNLYVVYPYHDSWGPSPHRQRIEFPVLSSHLKNRTSDMCTLGKECTLISVNYAGHDTLTALPRGIGVQFQQRFTQYLTTFFNAELPKEFTVSPDT